MGNFESFLTAYEKSGGTLMEGKFTQDPAQAVKMVSNFAPNDLPAQVVNPVPAVDGQKALADAKANAGNVAYSYTGGRKEQPAPMIAYRGAAFNPQGSKEATRFTEPEWKAMVDYYNANKDVLAANKPDGGDGADKEVLGPPPLEMDLPAADQEGAKPYFEEQAELAFQQQRAFLAEVGLQGPDIDTWTKSNQRQMRGLGARTLIFKAAQEAFEERDATIADIDKAAEDLTSAQNRLMSLAYQLKNNITTCDNISESDRDFLMNCTRLRGTGKSRGVYMKGGSSCGGQLAAIGGEQLTNGGDVYGLKLGSEKSPVYRLADGLDEKTCNVDGKEKPLVPRGRLASAAKNQFNAINGEMNEHYAELAHLLFVEKNTRGFKKAYREMVSQMGDKHNTRLFLQVAEGKAAGDIDQLEVASMSEEGAVQLVDDIAEEFGESPDQKKALQWLITKNLLNFKDVVESLPPGFSYKKVGDIQAGITDDGRSVNADIEAECPEGNAKGVYSRLVVNKSLDAKGDRQTEDPACFRASVKDDRGGPWIDTGKRSLGKLRALENEAVNTVREKQADYIQEIAGKDLPDDWRTQAETYRRNEVEYVDDMIATIGQIEPGALKDVASTQISKLDYEKLERYSQFYDRMEEYNKTKDPKVKRRLKAELTTALTQGYRARNSKNPGMRYNMAIEAAVTGMSTEREAFILTGDRGTYMGMESDVVGSALSQIIGGAKMEFTATKTKFMSEEGEEICNISLRRKETTASQFFVVSKEFAKNNLKLVAGSVDESLRAEDFVRQLQELIQRIDKVAFV